MKRGAPDHWKMKELARLCNVPAKYALPWANGVMERLWHYTAKYCIQGNIGKVPDEEIAEICGWPIKHAKQLVAALLASGWLNISEIHRLLIHDWNDHADDTVKKTLKNRGLQFIFPEKVGTIPEFSVLPSLSFPSQAAIPETISVVEDQAEPKFSKHAKGTDENECAERMYKLHPKKRNPQLILGALRMALVKSPDKQAAMIEIETCHAAWVKTENWCKESGRFAPPLAKWLADEGFTQWPNGAKPAIINPSKILPYDPFQFEKKQK